MEIIERFVNRLSEVSLENCFNPYADTCRSFDIEGAAEDRRHNVSEILDKVKEKNDVDVWIGRDLGYRGGRRTGVALTDEVNLEKYASLLCLNNITKTTVGPPVKEKTSSVIYSVIHGADVPIMTWNVFPFHPHLPLNEFSNRSHTRAEGNIGLSFLSELLSFLPVRNIVAIGNDAASALSKLGRHYQVARHPSYGGEKMFRAAMSDIYGPHADPQRQGELF